jgi:hypothetical protein
MTGDWRPLPASLDPELAYLVGVLRELKDRSGRSLDALAAETAVSKSSWQRYLNGTKLPSRYAVDALGRLAGEPTDRLLALWQQAEASWSRRAAADPPAAERPPAGPSPAGSSAIDPAAADPAAIDPAAADPAAADPAGADPAGAVRRPAEPAPAGVRRGWRWAVAVGAAAVLAGAAALAGVIAHDREPGAAAPAVLSPSPWPVPVGCHGGTCTGQDALDMACSVDAASYAQLRVAGAWLELRISDECRAGWARVAHAAAGEQVQVASQDGSTRSATIQGSAGTDQFLSTRMVGAGQHAELRACLIARDGVHRWCTPPGAERRVSVPAPADRPASPAPLRSGQP